MTSSNNPYNKDKLIVISAPSGAGKTTIVHYLLQQDLDLEFSISACSRIKRPNEKDKVDYYFLNKDEFRKKIEQNEFVEWEEVYPDQYYGTLKSELQRIWSKGYLVIFDVDVIGGINIKKLYQDKCLAIFIMPPTIQELEKRLKNRSTESEESLKKRIARAKKEMDYANKFDIIIINDQLEKAQNETEAVIRKFLKDESW